MEETFVVCVTICLLLFPPDQHSSRKLSHMTVWLSHWCCMSILTATILDLQWKQSSEYLAGRFT